jgi:hypothetical protein
MRKLYFIMNEILFTHRIVRSSRAVADEIMARKYEFFSWQGFIAGASLIACTLVVESLLSFPLVWQTRAFGYALLILSSALIVGITSGGVLVYLYPPDQDVIGIAGLGSDDYTQHISLILILLSLIGPIFFGFAFFSAEFSADPLIPIWVILSFVAPSVGLTVAMFERSREIAQDLRLYFSTNQTLDMANLDWLHGLGPRTATYRMGMLESAARRVDGLMVSGHEIVRDSSQFAVNR